MVGSQDEECVVSQTQFIDGGVETANQLIRPGHFAIVEPLGIVRSVGLGRLVGVVRIVQMDPSEESVLPVVRLEPSDGLVGCDVPALLDRIQEAGVVTVFLELVRVQVEATVEARLRRKDDGGNERRGTEARRLQDVGQGAEVIVYRSFALSILWHRNEGHFIHYRISNHQKDTQTHKF